MAVVHDADANPFSGSPLQRALVLRGTSTNESSTESKQLSGKKKGGSKATKAACLSVRRGAVCTHMNEETGYISSWCCGVLTVESCLEQTRYFQVVSFVRSFFVSVNFGWLYV